MFRQGSGSALMGALLQRNLSSSPTSSHQVALMAWATSVGGAHMSKKFAIEPSSDLSEHLAYRAKRREYHINQQQQAVINSSSSTSSTNQKSQSNGLVGSVVVSDERGLIAKEAIAEGSILLTVPLSGCLSTITYPSAVLDSRHPSFGSFVSQYPTFKAIPPPLKFFRAFRDMIVDYNTYVDQVSGGGGLMAMDDGDDDAGGASAEYLQVTDRELEYLWLGCVIGATAAEIQRFTSSSTSSKPSSGKPTSKSMKPSVADREEEQQQQQQADASRFFEQLPFSYLVSSFPTDTTPFTSAMQYYSESPHSPLSTEERGLLSNIHKETTILLDMAAEICTTHRAKNEGRKASSSSSSASIVELFDRDHIGWGFRQAVSRATILPFSTPTSPLDIGSWLESASEAQQAQSALHAAIVPLVDMINHPPAAPLVTRAKSTSSNLPECTANTVAIVCLQQRQHEQKDSKSKRGRGKIAEVDYSADPEMKGVIIYPEHNEIELDGDSSVLGTYDGETGGALTANTSSSGAGATSRDFAVAIMSTSRISAGSEIYIDYDLPAPSTPSSSSSSSARDEGNIIEKGTTTGTGGAAAGVSAEERVASLYRFGFLE